MGGGNDRGGQLRVGVGKFAWADDTLVVIIALGPAG